MKKPTVKMLCLAGAAAGTLLLSGCGSILDTIGESGLQLRHEELMRTDPNYRARYYRELEKKKREDAYWKSAYNDLVSFCNKSRTTHTAGGRIMERDQWGYTGTSLGNVKVRITKECKYSNTSGYDERKLSGTRMVFKLQAIDYQPAKKVTNPRLVLNSSYSFEGEDRDYNMKTVLDLGKGKTFQNSAGMQVYYSGRRTFYSKTTIKNVSFCWDDAGAERCMKLVVD